MKELLFIILFLSFSLSTYAKVEENYDYINDKYWKILKDYNASFSSTWWLILINEPNIENIPIDYTSVDSKKEDIDKKIQEFMDFEFYWASKPWTDCRVSTRGNLKNIRNSIFSIYWVREIEVEQELKTLSNLQTEIPTLYESFKTKYDTNIKYAWSILENYNADYLTVKDKYTQYMTTKRKLDEAFKRIFLISDLTYQTCIKPQLETQEWYAKNSPKTETKASSLSVATNKKNQTIKKETSVKKTTPSDEKTVKSNTDYLLKVIKKEGDKLNTANKIMVYKQIITELNKLIESENVKK
jgi:hypothetical protein